MLVPINTKLGSLHSQCTQTLTQTQQYMLNKQIRQKNKVESVSFVTVQTEHFSSWFIFHAAKHYWVRQYPVKAQ